MKKILSALVLVFVMLTSVTSAFAAAPQVRVTAPWSEDPNHPDYLVNQPLVEWTQYDPDPGQYFKDFQVIIYDSNWNIVYDSGILPQNSTANDRSFYVPVSLPRGQVLAVGVVVHDNTGEQGGKFSYMYLQP